MVLNWTLAVYLGFIASVIMFVVLIKAHQLARTTRIRYIELLSICWFFELLWCFTQTLSYLFLSIPLHFFSLYVFIPTGMILAFSLDLMSKDAIDAKKTMIFGFMTGTAVYSSFEPDAVQYVTYPNGELTLSWGGAFQLILSVYFIVFMFFLFSTALQIYRNAPLKLKKDSKLFLIGSFVTAILTSVLDGVFSIEEYIPSIDFIIASIGSLIMIIALTRAPFLGYILPFKLYRIAILDSKSGRSIYAHTWQSGENFAEPGMFSGVMQGVNLIVRESLNVGEVEEMKLSNASLIFKRSAEYNITCVLVVSKTSRTLRESLLQFVNKFLETYRERLLNPVPDAVQFSDAHTIVQECFPYAQE